MTSLVSLDDAKMHLRIETTDFDTDIAMKIEQATELCLEWIARRGDEPAVDGDPVVPWDETTVPPPIQAAILMQLSQLYDDRNAGKVVNEIGRGYLTPTVVALLHRFRKPVLA